MMTISNSVTNQSRSKSIRTLTSKADASTDTFLYYTKVSPVMKAKNHSRIKITVVVGWMMSNTMRGLETIK